MANDPLFHCVTDAHVILRARNGVYRQAKLYRRERALFAGYGGGFVRLLGREGTSHPDVSWLAVFGADFHIDRLGRPELRGAPVQNGG